MRVTILPPSLPPSLPPYLRLGLQLLVRQLLEPKEMKQILLLQPQHFFLIQRLQLLDGGVVVLPRHLMRRDLELLSTFLQEGRRGGGRGRGGGGTAGGGSGAEVVMVVGGDVVPGLGEGVFIVTVFSSVEEGVEEGAAAAAAAVVVAAAAGGILGALTVVLLLLLLYKSGFARR